MGTLRVKKVSRNDCRNQFNPFGNFSDNGKSREIPNGVSLLMERSAEQVYIRELLCMQFSNVFPTLFLRALYTIGQCRALETSALLVSV